MLIEIVRRTPPWVWLLLAALLALGIAQLRPRRVSRGRLVMLPAVLATMGLVGTATSFVPPGPALLAWATGLAAGSWLGTRLPRDAGLAWVDGRLSLPGSVLPLAVIVVVFSMRYAGSVALVLHPAWRSALAVALPMAAAFGAVTGLLAGRTLGLLRLPRTASA